MPATCFQDQLLSFFESVLNVLMMSNDTMFDFFKSGGLSFRFLQKNIALKLEPPIDQH